LGWDHHSLYHVQGIEQQIGAGLAFADIAPISYPVAAGFGAKTKSRFDERACTMTKMSFATHPFLLGFEGLDRLVERTAKTGNEGYPPYNIEQTATHAYRITLAIAGFREEDLSITVEDRQLAIRGRQPDEEAGRTFLHRGIAARQFQRTFVLADGVEVAGASMENGLLYVDLKKSVPDTIVQTIKITKG
jgi:HSP20 family molecular chaperone IbpA